MSKLRLLAAAFLVFVVGCFPVELSVSKDGKLLIPREEGFFVFDPASGKTAKLAGADGGSPVFARFSPDGKEALVVSSVSSGFGSKFSFKIMPLSGGEGRVVYKDDNTAYVLYSPDGAKLAITRGAEKEDPEIKQRLPELHIVPVQGGGDKVVANNVGSLFRWLPDSKRVLVLKIQKKIDSNYQGQISTVDVTSGKITPLVSALVDSNSFCDVSPDGKKALFTAMKVDKPGTQFTKDNRSEMKLYELDLESAAVRPIDKKARYAIYSPNGKQVLVGGPGEGFSMDSLALEVGDADVTNLKKVAPNAHMPMMSMGGEGVTYPGWINDKTIFYLIQKKNYGTSGKCLSLMTVGTDGGDKKCVQPLIDIEAIK